VFFDALSLNEVRLYQMYSYRASLFYPECALALVENWSALGGRRLLADGRGEWGHCRCLVDAGSGATCVLSSEVRFEVRLIP
jgi:hypothetical protein